MFCVASMSLPEVLVLEESRAKPKLVLLSFLRWQDYVSLASVSRRLFTLVKTSVLKLATDVSCGASQCPIPCDLAPHCACPERRLKSLRDWWIGGPVPPSFAYLSASIYPLGAPDGNADDLLEGCSCEGACTEDARGESSCPCVELNSSAHR